MIKSHGVRRPVLADVENLPLVGGRLCLDFVNTTGARDSARPRERLGSYPDLLVWSRRAGVLPGLDEMRLADLARQRPAPAAQALERVLELRELLYRVFRALLARESPATADLAVLSQRAAEAAPWRVLDPEGPRLVWRARPPQELDGMLWPVVSDAAELLVSQTMARLRKCGECDWLFLDGTRNGRRRFCKKTCGDRVKSRRYYARRRR